MPPVVAVFTKNKSNPAYAAARLAADLVAGEAGARTIHYVPETPDDVGQQKALVAQALEVRPDIVIFVPVDDVKMVEDAARFTAAGIPVVLGVNRMQGEFVTFVGSDDVEVGRASARALFEGLGGKGKVVAIEGTPAAPTMRDRTVGLHRTLAESPGIELLGSAIGMNHRTEGRQAMETLLARHPHIDGVWTGNDVMAYGVIEALDRAGRSARIVGTNGLAEAIGLIEAGRMLATVDFSAFKICHLAAQAALRHLKGERIPPAVKLPTVVIDKSNCAAWKVPFEQRPPPVWQDYVR